MNLPAPVADPGSVAQHVDTPAGRAAVFSAHDHLHDVLAMRLMEARRAEDGQTPAQRVRHDMRQFARRGGNALLSPRAVY